MTRAPLLFAGLGLGALALGCGGDPVPVDAAGADAALGDAPGLDAPGLDAPGLDAPGTDIDAGSGADAGPSSMGCLRSGEPVGLQPGITFVSSGGSRLYTLSVPDDYSPTRSYALVFAFHGDGGRGDTLRGTLGLEAAATEDTIFVYPDALPPARSWNIEAPRGLNDDLFFVEELADDLADRYCVATSRVFATGFSRGGFFTNWLECQIGAERFRAVAPMAGSIYSVDPSQYGPEGFVICPAAPAPARLVHGAIDPTVVVADGRYARDQWIFGHGCADAPVATDPSPCVSYASCTSGGRVDWCEIPGLAHMIWPQAGAAVMGFFEGTP